MSSYEDIVATLNRFAEEAKVKPLTFGEALDSLDQAAYALIALILVLPFMQPVPLGPLTVVGGLTFATLGWQMWRGNDSPVLPQNIRKIAMSEKTWRILVTVCLKVINFCTRFTKPRYFSLVRGERGRKIGAIIFISAGLLMAIPFGVLPFNNVLPGFAILFYCLSQFEEDGLMVMISFFWLIFTVVYFVIFFFALWYLGSAAVMRWFS
ncbi:MAG: exopolysaccharide biosynthesis protein [Methylophilaceae bacterium]|uniref:exopolysaccharide biosynthesis protein n=1 Tax=Methylovorus sp. MM2 TaxID=1848038 RepID=UPI0007E0F725|nr:exopolysaccharide biosynthesis protein [Methylovorus sp. MM2]OAM52111.1 exopolysaccharide biosynthesis protein exod [Methylovorus sp. MM2]